MTNNSNKDQSSSSLGTAGVLCTISTDATWRLEMKINTLASMMETLKQKQTEYENTGSIASSITVESDDITPSVSMAVEPLSTDTIIESLKKKDDEITLFSSSRKISEDKIEFSFL
eukprot:CAMPEP_0194149942 /NCGR_PEP_ID=MMETSP0152-20130528/40673_1 /TAXON_ID=1049557 /ORGANISM="Thalassiothrix antarctica, Strain L6-D1" /LENGTH=115 /DNA_ID=CAMNT_0038852493 /DNA_START=904 /DNA_END=1251 /DNA_ORIENTATION=-